MITRKFFDLLVFSNIYIALAVASLAYSTQLIFYDSYSPVFPVFVLCATLFLYSFHRAYRMNARSEAEQRERRHAWVRENKMLFYAVFAAAAAGLAYLTFAFLSFKVILWLLPVAVIAFGYSVPFIPVHGKTIRLRDIHLLKIFLIVFVIAWVTVLLPVVYFEGTLRTDERLWMMFVRRMLFVMAITIPFDIRDIVHDSYNRLKTIPVVLGERKAITVSYLLLSLFSALAMIEWMLNYLELRHMIALISSSVIAAIIISFSSKERKEYFYTFLVEGALIIQFILIAIAWCAGS